MSPVEDSRYQCGIDEAPMSCARPLSTHPSVNAPEANATLLFVKAAVIDKDERLEARSPFYTIHVQLVRVFESSRGKLTSDAPHGVIAERVGISK